MKKNLFVIALLALPLCAWAGNHKNNNVSKWDKYPLGKVIFTDKDKVSNGAKIYHKIIPNPEAFIQTQAKQVLNTLYYSPKDSRTFIQPQSVIRAQTKICHYFIFIPMLYIMKP